ncbi:hypothetical protein GQ55_5G197000 [Panicum hallii var. hallii]|uniref:Uncharacterized protein n=1 Tax=Panicum hallii var. hallii TaxID=1504633 RepID=A0A2T7DI41_9POAL|nr:hypothetical protein GQ55_5G197000 [Panicum hallii var. hallii]
MPPPQGWPRPRNAAPVTTGRSNFNLRVTNVGILQPAAPPVAGGRRLLRQPPPVIFFSTRKREPGVRTAKEAPARRDFSGSTRVDVFLHGFAWYQQSLQEETRKGKLGRRGRKEARSPYAVTRRGRREETSVGVRDKAVDPSANSLV